MVLQEVPDVIGKNIDEAKTTIEEANFKVGKITKSHDPNVPENCVISQDPISHIRMLKDTEINLVVSEGPEMIAVPTVIGKSRKEAADVLERAGFKVEYGEDEFSKTVEVGNVCKQDPEGGVKAAKDSIIKIVISKGTESVVLPDLTNYTESDARSKLESLGFIVSIKRESSDRVEKGYVISQSPSSGQKIDKGTTVTITVSEGTNLVSVPDVTGKPVEQAKSTLQQAGFNVSVSGTGTKVKSMNPVGGNRVEKGSTITLVLEP